MKRMTKEQIVASIATKSKDQLSLSEKILCITGMAKAIDTAAGLNISSALEPQQADQILSAIVSKNEFISKIRTEIMNSTKLDLNCYNIAARGSVRPSPIVAAMTDTDVNVTNVGTTLDLKPMQLRYFLDYQIIQDKAWQSNFQSMLEQMLFEYFSNEIADLALNGTSDAYAASAWAAMNKGFPTLFAADTNVADVTFANYEDRFELYKALSKAMPEMHRNRPGMALFDNDDGVIDYWSILATQDTTSATMQQANNAPKFGSKPIISVPYMPASKAFMTPLDNLVLGLGRNGLKLDVIDDPEAYGVKIILTAMVDFGYVSGVMVSYAS